MSKYQGWTLFDKVELVLKQERVWREGQITYGPVSKAYVVDPSNKSMHESAINWGTWSTYEDDEQGNRVYKKIPPEVIILDNSGFTLELLEAANGSSQGGKLSFWNCLISKDGQSWKIGIGSDLLCELLKQSTFVNGVCQQPVFFARRNGNVGMLHNDCQAYKDAVADMKAKATIKSAKKTKKWEQGRNYVTLKESTMYLCPIYCWVEPVYEECRRGWCSYNEFRGYKRLDKPKKLYVTSDTSSVYNRMSGYFTDDSCWLEFRDSLPSRASGNLQIKLDMTNAEVDAYMQKQALNHLTLQCERYNDTKAKNLHYNIYSDRFVGVNTSPTTPPDYTEISKLLEEMGLSLI